MARVRVATLLIAALLSCAGCSALFEFNAFSSLDKPAAPKLADYQGSGGLAKLKADLSSAAVVAQFKADPATTRLVEDYLATYLPPVDSDGQVAAVLYADLYLKTTSGDQLVNNAVAAVISPPSGTDIKTILSEIIPADVSHDQAAFEAMVDGLVKAKIAYSQLGTSLGPSGVPPEGMNMGDVAQKAVVAYLMDVIVVAVDPLAETSGSSAAAEQLFLLLNGQPNDITTNGITLSSTPLLDSSGDPIPELHNITKAAGMPYPA
jgi:hypothetical protein